MEEKSFRSIYFCNDASVNTGKISFVHLRERQAQFLVAVRTSERRKQQTSADFAGYFNPST